MSNDFLKILGGTLITAGIVPTPDDVTIISPLIQIALGSFLIYLGSRK